MISDRDLVSLHLKGSPYQNVPVSRDKADAWMKIHGKDGRWELIKVPSCLCCGEPAWDNLRCTKHQDRNPCVVEGCKRTRKAHGHLQSDAAVCGEHFKAYVRPGSRARRILNAHYRRAKRMGYERNQRWHPALEQRYWTYWHFLMGWIRRRSSEGEALDEAEIKKLFGWD